jgi:hypothetical protein
MNAPCLLPALLSEALASFKCAIGHDLHWDDAYPLWQSEGAQLPKCKLMRHHKSSLLELSSSIWQGERMFWERWFNDA